VTSSDWLVVTIVDKSALATLQEARNKDKREIVFMIVYSCSVKNEKCGIVDGS
jgi:hypothetical protein